MPGLDTIKDKTMNQHFGKGLADAIAILPQIVVKLAPQENREDRVAAVGLLTSAVQQAIHNGDLTQNDVIHALMVVMAGTIVIPDKGMPDDDMIEMLTDGFRDYATGIGAYVTQGKSPNHPTSPSVN
ncbi:hypothetical protein EVC30_124 [Rhizobium phage RHph_Y1_11]|nr:hypothetical protein EVC30_124 [Rhizobium phage RHph_Y1_11]